MLKHVAQFKPPDGNPQYCKRCGVCMSSMGSELGFREGATIVQHGPQMRCWTDLRLYEVTGTPLSQAPNCR